MKKLLQVIYQKYILDGLSAMALGLFASLIVGLILRTSAEQLLNVWPDGIFLSSLQEIGSTAIAMMGPAIAIAVAYKLKAPLLVLVASMVAGQLGAVYGGPAGAYLSVVLAIEAGSLVSKKTPLDIIITPTITMIAGFLVAISAGQLIGVLMSGLGIVIVEATKAQPFVMGIIVSVLMGMILTAPISSAALALMLQISGLAAGAATAGCCAQMVGFALMSRKDNKSGEVIAQGLGTSMLQVSNIIRNPWIWVPPTLAAAITGPLATVVFKMENVAAGAGMGTSGLVGILLTLQTMGFTVDVLIKILVLYIVLPGILSVLFYEILVKMNKIKVGDCTIKVD
ncbi:MAG: PTS sugar transporter subunit IIC [Erysipelotrichaceae bacterium]|nr:PTS sugar transporter subunit IIC [Erysipelotrichaceae bacterium]MDP3305765.1 PTS sugar transporter subunit IIC [Erysipelotrichaceae bacterium]